MMLPTIITHQVNTVIKSLKNKYSSINDISTTVIKRNSELFSLPLTILFNQSVATGIFPTVLKIANITPIHKSGPNDDLKNYRPISQLTVFSKIFESLMKLNGFTRNCNTFIALNTFLNYVFSAIDKKLNLLSIFIDFAKAFDTINHKILLK